MIYAFQYPHRVGSICRAPCEQCNEQPGEVGEMSDADGPIGTQPLFIVRLATRAEYIEWTKTHGKLPPIHEGAGYHYYEVQTD